MTMAVPKLPEEDEVGLTPAEIAKVLEVTPETVRKAIRQGKLKASKSPVDGRNRSRLSDVEEWLAIGRRPRGRPRKT